MDLDISVYKYLEDVNTKEKKSKLFRVAQRSGTGHSVTKLSKGKFRQNIRKNLPNRKMYLIMEKSPKISCGKIIETVKTRRTED